jgi:hypothetical protein
MKHIFLYSLLLLPIALFSAQKQSDRVPQILVPTDGQKTEHRQQITNLLPHTVLITSGENRTMIFPGRSMTISTPGEICIKPFNIKNHQVDLEGNVTQRREKPKVSSEEEPCIQQ